MKVKSESEVTESCPTLSDPMDCSLPGPSVHGIFQARVLEWGAITSWQIDGETMETVAAFILGGGSKITAEVRKKSLQKLKDPCSLEEKL